MSLRDEAEELAIALELGFASVEEAVEWAGANIDALEKPPYELMEVSCAGRSPPAEIAHLLRTIPGAPDVASASRRVIARMAAALDRGSAQPEHVAGALYSMYLNGGIPEPEAESEMIRLDDAFALAHQGVYGSRKDAETDLRELLGRYLP